MSAPPPSDPTASAARRSVIWALVLLAIVAVLGLLAPHRTARAAADTEPGRQVFDMHCAMCHGQDASGMMGMHPSLRGAVDRLTREGVEVTVRRGRDTQPPMPAFEDRLTDQELDAVVDHIATLPSGPRNFGPGTGGGMMDGMMGGSATAMWVVVAVLTAVLAGVVGGLVGFLIGRRR